MQLHQQYKEKNVVLLAQREEEDKKKISSAVQRLSSWLESSLKDRLPLENDEIEMLVKQKVQSMSNEIYTSTESKAFTESSIAKKLRDEVDPLVKHMRLLNQAEMRAAETREAERRMQLQAQQQHEQTKKENEGIVCCSGSV